MQLCESTDYDKRSRVDIDTMAEIVCAGSTFKLVERTGKVIDVEGFHSAL